MKKLILMPAIVCSLMWFTGCNTASRPVQTNSAAAQASNDHPQTMIAHSSEDQTIPANTAASGNKTKWTQSGNPIDTAEFDAAITAANAALKSKPADAAAKKAASEAYYKRGVALTDARQYASALGDYRKALKLDPSNEQAKQWIEQITQIYDSINRESPKEGEEPPPLPFKKDAATEKPKL